MSPPTASAATCSLAGTETTYSATLSQFKAPVIIIKAGASFGSIMDELPANSGSTSVTFLPIHNFAHVDHLGSPNHLFLLELPSLAGSGRSLMNRGAVCLTHAPLPPAHEEGREPRFPPSLPEPPAESYNSARPTRMSIEADVTQLLLAWKAGNQEARSADSHLVPGTPRHGCPLSPQ